MGFEECILNKGVRLCVGISKQIFYIFNWIQIIKYITNENKTDIDFYGFLLCAIFLGVVYVWSLCWLFFSKTKILLKNTNDNNSINNVMDTLFHEKPVIKIICSCYHFKTKVTPDSIEVSKIETFNETKELNVFSYIDISGIFRLKETNKSLIELQLEQEIEFNDEITIYDIQKIKNELYLKNKNEDYCIHVYLDKEIPSMKYFYLIKLSKDKNYCLLKKWIYILCVFLMIDLFYRIYLDYISSKQKFKIRKIVSSRYNVYENNKYSQFIPGYFIQDSQFVASRENIGGVGDKKDLLLPTEEELKNAQIYNKFIPEYNLNENGDIVNINPNLFDTRYNIKEERNIFHINELKQNNNNFIAIKDTSLDNNFKEQKLINDK